MAEASPELAEVVENALASRLEDLNVAAPGVVVSYDTAKQTAEVRLAWHRPTLDTDGGVVSEEIPPIPNVPVLWPRTASFSITAVLHPGDTVLLVFNTRSPTPWRRTGSTSAPEDLRIHGLGYPVAIPGYLPDTTPISDTDESIGVPGGLRLHFTETAIEAGTGASKVALAPLVAIELGKLQTALAAAPGGPISYTPGSVASTNLGAD